MEEFKNNFMNVVQNNYMNFKGRARRKELWQYLAVYMIISILVSIIVFVLTLALGSVGATIGSILNAVVGLGLLLPTLGVWFRRMQDVNKPGWFLIIPIYNIILAIQEGDKGANQFGEDPKA